MTRRLYKASVILKLSKGELPPVANGRITRKVIGFVRQNKCF